MQPILLTASEVQRMFDVDRSTVYRMATDGRLPAIKIGRQWRFPADAIRRFVSFSDPTAELNPQTLATEATMELVETVAEALGVMMVITDLAGRPLIPVANPCPRFSAIEGDPEAVEQCAGEWQELAESTDQRPQFRLGPFGFMCARSFVRVGGRRVAMVLAGGVAPEGDQDDDLFILSDEQRRRVVSTLPKVAALLTRFDQRSIV